MTSYIKKTFFVALILSVTLILSISLSSCSNSNNYTNSDSSEKPTIVCTGFAEYDWIRNILGENLEDWNLIRLNDNGVDMHSYQPTAEDMVDIANSDLVVYAGGESEEWIETAMEKGGTFSGIEYGLVENGVAIENDEHIWLSPKQAIVFCQELTDIISNIDEEHKTQYEANCEAYVKKLENLDSQYAQLLSDCSENLIICADRFPFRYLVKDYGLEYAAAFTGCEAETEADFDTVIMLSDKLKNGNINTVFVCEGSDTSLAETIIKNSGKENVKVLVLNSIQSVNAKDKDTSYIKIMEENLEVLKEALI
jgi:zinc transport system substrate-binding protein